MGGLVTRRFTSKSPIPKKIQGWIFFGIATLPIGARLVGKDASVFSGESLPILYGNIRYYNTKIWGYFF